MSDAEDTQPAAPAPTSAPTQREWSLPAPPTHGTPSTEAQALVTQELDGFVQQYIDGAWTKNEAKHALHAYTVSANDELSWNMADIS